MAWVARPDGMEEWVEEEEGSAQPGLLRKGWEALSKPLTHYAGLDIGGAARKRAEETELGLLEKSARGEPGGDPASVFIQNLPGQVAARGAGVLESLTAPLNLILAATTAGAGVAAGAGRTGLAQVLRVGEAAAGAGISAEGVKTALDPEADLEQRLMGGAMAFGGAAGVGSGLAGAASARRAARISPTEAPMRGEIEVPSSAMREDVPELALAGGLPAGHRATRAAFIKRLNDAGVNATESTFRGKTVDYIRQYAKDRGVDLSDVVIQRLPETSLAAEMTPDEILKILPPKPPKLKADEVLLEAPDMKLGDLLRKRRAAEDAGQVQLVEQLDQFIEERWGKAKRPEGETRMPGPGGEVLESDVAALEKALKQADEQSGVRAEAKKPESYRTSQMSDPVEHALENVTNIMLDALHARGTKTEIGQHFGPRTPVEEAYQGAFDPTPETALARGVRDPKWMQQAGFNGELRVSRAGNALSALRDIQGEAGVPASEILKRFAAGDPAVTDALSQAYRKQIIETMAHETLHGYRDTIDFSQGQPIPHMQEVMDRSALQFLDTPDVQGKTLRQELAAWMEPKSPATQEAWLVDFQAGLAAAAHELKVNHISTRQLGLWSHDARQVATAAGQKKMGGPIDTLPDSLKERLRFAFTKQRLGRVEAAELVKRLRGRQAGTLIDLEKAVEDGKMTPQEAQIEYRRLASQESAGIQQVEVPAFSEAEKSQLIGLSKNKFRDVFDRYRAGDAMEKLIKGEQLTEADLGAMRKAFGRDAIGDLKPTWFEEWGNRWMKLSGSMRAAMTSGDVSGVLRQALIPSISHPVLAARALKASLTKIWSDETYMAMERSILNNPLKQLQSDSGLHLSQPGGGMRFVEALEVGGAEEMFAPNYAQSVPVLGKVVKYSERSYITYLNKMRSDLFNKMAVQYMKAGISPEEHIQVYKDLGHAINDLTGRGEFGEIAYVSPSSKIGKALGIKETLSPGKAHGGAALPLMNALFFAPRFMWSRLAILRDLPLLYTNYSAPVRNMMLRDVFTTIGTGLTVLAATAELTGGKLESDPRSSDFGKLRVGDTRYDPWGGLQPWVRFVAQMLSQQKKPVNRRRAVPFKHGEGRQTLYRFFEQKGSPSATLALDALFGEKAYGEQANFLDKEFPFLGKDLVSRVTPIIAQDIYDLWNEGEAEQLAIAMPLSALGVGVQTYDRKMPTRRVNP